MTALARPLAAALPALRARWAALSLATRFAAAAALVLVPATLAIGAFVAARIEEAVVRNAGQATALFIDAVIAPIGQQFGESGDLSPGARRALEEVLATPSMRSRVASFKFWDRSGRIVWAQDPSLVGRRFDLTPAMRRAFAGEVVASFDDLAGEEDAAEAALGLPLLEIYSPVREVWSGEVIALAEFYEVAPGLRRDLRAAEGSAWAFVAAVVLGTGGLLWVIVRGGSRTIEAQRLALDAQVAELRQLSGRNRELRLRVQAAAARAAAQTDRTLRALGADLHDGPAQHLAYAALRLDSLRDRLADRSEAAGLAAEFGRVAEAVGEAMREVRALSRGLQLPDLEGRPLLEVVRDACAAHEARSGHPVALRAACPAEPALAAGAKLCVLRFLQETLANASRHGEGRDLEVALHCGAGELRLATRDRGPGLAAEVREEAMGLAGLRDRVESLGGSFHAATRGGGGAEVAMTLETGGPA